MPTPIRTTRNYFAALAEIQKTLGASREQAREIWQSLKQRSGVAPSVGAIRQIPRNSRPALKAAATKKLKREKQAKIAAPAPKPKPKQPAKIIQIGPDGVRYVVGVIPPEPERPPAIQRTEPIQLRKPPAPQPIPIAEAAPIQERKPRNRFEQLLQERDVPYLSGEAAKLAAQLWRSPQKQKKLANILRQAHRSIASSGRVADSVRDALSKFIRSVNWPDSNWFSFLRTLYA